MNYSPVFAWTPSLPELIIICVVIVLLFGAKKLPELSRSVGKSISEFKKGKEEAERELESMKEENTKSAEDAKS
ncbi:MAG: twin-arginine translocase TatA/TatE family subunit [Verrucomicrobia bacterium]|nr:twin-arginine translocase TatA/TatE family subunit [Verrucomicrobiota bacterium]MCH8525877.1 twin-arginine translocase TatA/TatE family subunit [Kiritimatiellia bacterium]